MEGLNILEVIKKYDQVSQRDISRETGLSLGMVNMLVKKFLKVGFLKAERLNGNKIKYILTPKGSQFLFEKTLNFVKRSYTAIQKISGHVEDVILREFPEDEVIPVVGEAGEILDIVCEVSRRLGKHAELVDENSNYEKVLYIERGSDCNGVGIFEGLSV